jgi:hypothetical protein
MRVFISWSGERSRTVAEALHDWLPSVIQAVQPWMSANDIEKGTRWRSGLANELEQASVSIICLTPENLEAPWIHFEAGALSKQQQNTYVCTFLFGLEPIDIREPLAQFQATTADKEDTLKLIHTINRLQSDAALPEGKVNEAFDVWWPKLEQRLSNIQKPQEKQTQQIRSDPYQQLEHQRDVREILAEILELVRAQSRAVQSPMLRGLSGIKPRLPTTLDWTPEDAQLLLEYYEQIRSKALKRQIDSDQDFARTILELIKKGEIEIQKPKQVRTEPNANSVLADQEMEQPNENYNS